jgi:hypothetical protein
MNDDAGSKILEFFHAAAVDPSLIEQYREGGVDYLRDEWAFTDEEIALIEGRKSPYWVMTVYPQPPIIWPPDWPTVFS